MSKLHQSPTLKYLIWKEGIIKDGEMKFLRLCLLQVKVKVSFNDVKSSWPVSNRKVVLNPYSLDIGKIGWNGKLR